MKIGAAAITITAAMLCGCAGQYRQVYEKEVVGETEWDRELTQRGAIYRTADECNAALKKDLVAEELKRDYGRPYEKLHNAHCEQVSEKRKKAETVGAIAGAVLCVATGVASGVASGGAVVLCPP